MWLWSNPTPNNNTLAAMQSDAKILGPDSSHIVSAIMQMREQEKQRAEQSQQQAISNIVKGASGAVAAYQQQSDSGKLADFVNLGMQDQSDALMTPEQEQLLSSMSGPERLKALQWLDSQQDQSRKEDASNSLLDAKINEMNAHAEHWSDGSGSDGGGDNGLVGRREMANRQAQLDAIKTEIAAQIGVPKGKVDAELGKLNSTVDTDKNPIGPYTPGRSVFPQLGAHPEIKDGSEGEFKQNIIDARQRYLDAARQISQPPQSQPQAQSQPNDMRAQAAEILRSSGKPVTDANIAYVIQQLSSQQ
jgi:hypothetical protein